MGERSLLDIFIWESHQGAILPWISKMLLAIDYEARTGSPVSEYQVVLLIISLSNGENNCRIGSTCSLQRYGSVPNMRLSASSQYFVGKMDLIFLLYVFLYTQTEKYLVPYLEHWSIIIFVRIKAIVIEYRIFYGTRVLYDQTILSLVLDSISLNVRRT